MKASKILAALVIVAMAGGLAPSSQRSASAAEPVVATATQALSTAAFVEGVRSLLDEVIERAEQAGNFLAFRAGVEARLTIDSWTAGNEALLRVAFAGLEENHQRALGDLKALTVRISRALDAKVEGGKELLDQVAFIAERLIFWNDDPAVFRYGPSVVAPTSPGASPVAVKVRGVNIEGRDARLRVGAFSLDPVARTSQELVFEIPPTAFTFAPNLATTLAAELEVSAPHGSWLRRVFGQEEIRSFRLAFLQLPTNLGSYEITYETERQERRTKRFEREFSIRHGGMSDKHRKYNVHPSAEERRIDAESVRALRDWGDKGGYRILDVTERGFVVDVWTKRWIRGFRGGPGYRHVRVAYREYWREPVRESRVVAGSLNWLADALHELPKNTTKVAVKVRLFNGREITWLDDGQASIVDVEYNSSTKQLVIRPAVPAAIGA